MSILILGERCFIEGESPEALVGMEGYYTMRARRSSGRVTRERTFKVSRETGPFHNLITNIGMNRFGSETAGNIINRCLVGTGTAAPSFADVGLANFLASVQPAGTTTTDTGASGAPDYFSWRTYTWTSAVGALGNNILTEIAVAPGNTNTDIFSRELIRDSVGNPTSFPISSDEQLEVTYELRLYVPQQDVIGTALVGSVTHDTTVRARKATTAINGWSMATGGLNPVTGQNATVDATLYTVGIAGIEANEPNGSARNGQADSIATAAYGTGNFYRDHSQSFGPTKGIGSNKSVTFSTNSTKFQVEYTPAIEKTGTQTLILHHRVSWARQ